MDTYSPSDTLVKATITAILSPLPFLAKGAAKLVPGKEMVVRTALALAIPAGLAALASTKPIGSRIVLTKHGELTDEAKKSLVRRIATWLVPDEVKELTSALQGDIILLGTNKYTTDTWRLEAAEGEVVLVVTGTTILKESVETVADILMGSFEALKKLRDYLPKIPRLF